MAFASVSDGPMANINVTPLVDVMLVLLIIFMIAVPALSYPVAIDLSIGRPIDQKLVPPDPVRLHVDASGTISWNGSPVSLTTLQSRLELEGARGMTSSGTVEAGLQPTLEIQADRDAEYDLIAKVMARAKNAELVKIVFIEANAAP